MDDAPVLRAAALSPEAGAGLGTRRCGVAIAVWATGAAGEDRLEVFRGGVAFA